uniref:Putative secreted protein n=1 Tax=Anopheles marajoara TaxID=58244 RepID=A0A2M4CB30_9DIPT
MRPYGASTLWFASFSIASKSSSASHLDNSLWQSLFTASSASSSTTPVMSLASKRQIASSRLFCISALMRCVISLLRSIDRPSS